MTEKEIDAKVSQIGHDAFERAGHAVKEALVRVHQESGSRNGADATRASFYGTLGGLVPAALLIAKREIPNHLGHPKTPDQVTEAHAQYMYSLIGPETLTFAALLTVQVLEKMSNEIVSLSFGPIQLREAMLQWKKLFPLSKPEDYLEASIVECVNQTEEVSTVTADELMAKVRKGFTLRNNGSIN